MKIIYILFALFAAEFISAQTFTYSVRTSVPDSNRAVYIPINVSGLPTVIDASFGLKKVCIDFNHTYIGDLTMQLVSPAAVDSLNILWHDGGGSHYSSNLCFHEDATDYIRDYPVGTSTDYYGEESINAVNDGRNPNGIWYLVIYDVVPIDSGYLNAVTLEFGSSPAATHTRVGGGSGGSVACSTAYPYLCQCPDGVSINCDLLPDMTNAELAISSSIIESPGSIIFGVATPNIGWGPLEIHGADTLCYCDSIVVPCSTTACPSGSEVKHQVYQTVYHRNDSTMTTYDRIAGLMEYHPTHGHIHVDHWTNNTIRIRSSDPNPTHWPILGTAYKISYCLVNLGTCSSYPGYCKDTNGAVLMNTDISNYGFGSVTGCSLDQGIYTGNLDIYGAGSPGQEAAIPGSCNGAYYVVSITDPDNIIKEINEDNNWSAVLLHLTGQPNNCCKANFHADTLHGVDSLIVQFSDSTIPIPNSWTWDFGDGTNSFVQFPLHKYAHDGVYTVKLYTSSETGCKDTAVKTSYIAVDKSGGSNGIQMAHEVMNVSVFPNPFKDQITLSFSVPYALSANISLYDVFGKEVFKSSKVVDSYRPFSINTNEIGLAAGSYFLKVNCGSIVNTFKIIKL